MALNDNICRWYRSSWGRYTQPDPIGLRAGANLFSYAVTNPTLFVDRRGLASVSIEKLGDLIVTREELRLRVDPYGGDPIYAATYAGRSVSCDCSRTSSGCWKLSVAIRVKYQFHLTTDDGNNKWPPLWRQRIEEGIHEAELIESTYDLKKLAEEDEKIRYPFEWTCKVNCSRLQNNSWLTKWWPGFKEGLPGGNPHPDDY
jgi:hypothetical protein